MTSPADLRPGREAPQPIELETVRPSAPELVRATYVRIWKPLAFSGRMEWSDTDWTQELSRPGVEAWLARVGDEIAGLVELEADADGTVGIAVFGLVPEFIGRGFGGPFLTVVTRLAGAMPSPMGVRRVWLQTYSRDHPHDHELHRARIQSVPEPDQESRRRVRARGTFLNTRPGNSLESESALSLPLPPER